MTIDIRAEAAKYYDLNPHAPADIPFYRRHLPSPRSGVLELGCGTGRVLVPLSRDCGFIHGIDAAASMISICREKLEEAGIPPERARVEIGDITDFSLQRTFDLVIAPYRVLQNLETDAEVDGLFRCLGEHLAPGGTAILNVFHPFADAHTLRRGWCTDEEQLAFEVAVPGGRVTCHDRRPGLQPEPLVIHPELVYRRYEGETLIEEVVLEIAMRCYYPDEFEKLVVDHGYRVLGRWGGYAGETYGQGTELVIQFARA